MDIVKGINKAALRQEILKERKDLPKKVWLEKSSLIYQQVVELPAFLRADQFFIYVDINNEVDTHYLIEQIWASGRRAAIPIVTGKEMIFKYISSFSELRISSYGVPEPVADAETACYNEKTLIVMPGVVFDLKRHRIGYGGGYYDRYLAGRKDAQTIALAFSLQIRDEIPANRYDIQPNIIITEDARYE